jgi:hypothetical protein
MVRVAHLSIAGLVTALLSRAACMRLQEREELTGESHAEKGT